MNHFNNALNDGNAIKRSFSGCTTTRMKYYAKEVIEEEIPDTICRLAVMIYQIRTLPNNL